jgi:hypothetical protein
MEYARTVDIDTEELHNVVFCDRDWEKISMIKKIKEFLRRLIFWTR